MTVQLANGQEGRYALGKGGLSSADVDAVTSGVLLAHRARGWKEEVFVSLVVGGLALLQGQMTVPDRKNATFSCTPIQANP
jgi:hypothetical protein